MSYATFRARYVELQAQLVNAIEHVNEAKKRLRSVERGRDTRMLNRARRAHAQDLRGRDVANFAAPRPRAGLERARDRLAQAEREADDVRAQISELRSECEVCESRLSEEVIKGAFA